MGKRYSDVSPDIKSRIAKLREKHYQSLEGVTITALFVFSDENEHVLSHQGYPALAVIKKTSTRDRAAGLADAVLVIDRFSCSSLTGEQINAMLDHELMHLDPVLDDAGNLEYDAIDRPKLTMRSHDRHFGWFDEIASRHGKNSIEVMQATALLKGEGGQLYFQFEHDAAA